jgi:hypothetical protein
MTMRSRPIVISIIVLALSAGCSHAPPAATRPSSVNSLDPCAERLHELSGLLLQYYGVHGRLPAKLDDAAALAPEGSALLACPVSTRPYIYDPKGPLVTAGGAARIVVYDATPAHNAMRWGIAVSEPKSGEAMTARILIVPENAVQKVH